MNSKEEKSIMNIQIEQSLPFTVSIEKLNEHASTVSYRLKVRAAVQFARCSDPQALADHLHGLVSLFIPDLNRFENGVSISYQKCSEQELEQLESYVSSLPKQLFPWSTAARAGVCNRPHSQRQSALAGRHAREDVRVCEAVQQTARVADRATTEYVYAGGKSSPQSAVLLAVCAKTQHAVRGCTIATNPIAVAQEQLQLQQQLQEAMPITLIIQRRSSSESTRSYLSIAMDEENGERREFTLDSNGSLAIINRYINSVSLHNLLVDELTINVKNASLLSSITFGYTVILSITLCFDTVGEPIHIPALHLHPHLYRLCFVNTSPAVWIEDEELRLHRSSHARRIRSPIHVDIRCVDDISSSDEPRLFSYFFEDVVPLIRHDQFQDHTSVTIHGNTKTIEGFMMETLHTVKYMSPFLTICHHDSRRFNEMPRLWFNLPSLPSLICLTLYNLVVDARSAWLPHLEEVKIFDASMFLLENSALFGSLKKLTIHLRGQSPFLTYPGGPGIYITEPRGIVLLTNVKTLLMNVPSDHILGNIAQDGTITYLLRQAKYSIKTPREVRCNVRIDEYNVPSSVPDDVYPTEAESIDGGHTDGGDISQRNSDADHESDSDDEDDDEAIPMMI